MANDDNKQPWATTWTGYAQVWVNFMPWPYAVPHVSNSYFVLSFPIGAIDLSIMDKLAISTTPVGTCMHADNLWV